ncbi:PREDICTED: myosin-11-like [Tarenaya hassleriana]|uniref:myosin-11-like n=1 Tax=Tarenaya hassleriana TaxID=28532 RepID=UPI00053C212C|nr:PREDICTED: myosin-11-like [Tarenaya hassleriana]
MAKKKATGQSNGAIEQIHDHDHKVRDTDLKAAALSRQSSMEDHDSLEEKVQSLKSLNGMLLRETVEKRQQIESMAQAKDALEAELAGAGLEKTELRGELSRESDENIGLKLEMDLIMAFVESWLGVMGDGVDGLVEEKIEREREIRVLKREAVELLGKLESEREMFTRVFEERDSIKSGFDLQKEETIRLRENVIGLEKKESILEDEINKLKSENNGLEEEKKNRDELIEQVKRERSGLEKALDVRAREIDDLKSEIQGLVRDNKALEIGKLDKEAKIVELEKKLNDLNEITQCLRNEERVLQDQILRLEKNLDEAMEKEKETAIQIDAFVKEKGVKESELEKLMEEKILIEKEMEASVMENSEKEKLIGVLSQKNNELEEHIVTRETELFDLKGEVDSLKHVLDTLKKDYSHQKEKNETFGREISRLRDSLAQVELERDDTGKALVQQNRQVEDLKSNVSELEKTIEATVKELEKMKTERESLVRENKEAENQSEALKNEKGILEKDLVNVKKAMDDLKAELETARANEERCLTMLKSTSSLLYQSQNTRDGFVSEEKEIEPYAMELEAIKNAFRNKEDVVEEMRKEVETMKHSVEEAHKRKSFWTIVSSATTIFAAASVAYAARIR